jgi:hypothetical protein
MFYIVKIYIFGKKIFYMMGKKKVQKVVQEGSGTSFLAGQVQPSPAPSEVSGKQEPKEEPKKVEPPKPKTLKEISLEEIEAELRQVQKYYKEFSAIVKELEKHKDFIINQGRRYLRFNAYEENSILNAYEGIYARYKEAYERLLRELGLAYAKKQFGIEI